MQTYLPYPDFTLSALTLDRHRLLAMSVEPRSILTMIECLIETRSVKRFGFHPMIPHWMGYEKALMQYQRTMALEWIRRGNNRDPDKIFPEQTDYELPPWFGKQVYHDSHKKMLMWKIARKEEKIERKLAEAVDDTARQRIKPLDRTRDFRWWWNDLFTEDEWNVNDYKTLYVHYKTPQWSKFIESLPDKDALTRNLLHMNSIQL